MAKGGFRGMPGGMSQQAMMKQAQKMQQQMLQMQEEMERKTYTAKAGGGMVTAEVNGKHEIVNLTINPRLWTPMMWRCSRTWSSPLSTRPSAPLMLTPRTIWQS